MQHFRFLAVLFGIWSTAFGADQFVLSRLSGPVKIDGLSDEPAWQQIEPLPLTMFTPAFQGQPTERTEILIAHDDHYLYVAGRMYDSEPERIQANSLVRDLDRGGDFLNILLDTFNDNETLTAFVTTPSGNRLDAQINNDAEGDDFFNQNWNAFWDCEIVQNDEGWFAEMRIPFSSLRFQDENGKVVFGLIAHRLIGRKNERLTFPAIEPKWAMSQWKASQAMDVVLNGVYRQKPVYVTPYALGGLNGATINSPNSNGFESNSSLARELGLDVKYGLTNNLALDVTLNTDFAQVEADNEQINLTRFSLFFPEKRQFFQERSGIFSFRTGDTSRLFHSRRIGLTEEGESVRILGGARLVGRIGEWDLGILNMQTGRETAQLSENFGVLRLRRRVHNERSYIGTMATSRIDEGGKYNLAFAADANLNLFASDYLIVKAARVIQKQGSVLLNDFADGSFASLLYERRNEKGFGFNTQVERSGKNFDPGIGFTLRTDFLRLFSGSRYGYFPGEASKFRRHLLAIDAEAYLRNSDQSVESALIVPQWTAELRSGTTVTGELEWHYEDLLQPFPIAENAGVPAGSYHYLNAGVGLQMTDGKRLRTNGGIEAGSFFDGTRTTLTLSPTWIQSRHLELGADYEFNRVRFSARDQAFDSNILRFRLQGAVDNRLSGNALLQYNSVDKNIGINARLRYNFSEGHDLYFVYNEVFDDNDRFQRFPNSSFDNRSFLVKYLYTFVR